MIAEAKVANLPPTRKGVKTRDYLAIAMNISPRMVDYGRIVINSGDDALIAQVEAGQLSLSKAMKIVRERQGRPAPKRTVTSQLKAIEETCRRLRDQAEAIVRECGENDASATLMAVCKANFEALSRYRDSIDTATK